MITDKIKNIDKYPEIPFEIREFIKSVSKDIPLGRVELESGNYANVESYTTKEHDKCFFEAHEKYADIQIILEGSERLDYVASEGLTVKVPYVDDIVFYENSKPETANITLDGTNFVLLYPKEAHRPQMCTTKGPDIVKKIVVKVKQNIH